MTDKVEELRKRRSEGGFTLVELLIVLAILAILVAVVLPNFTGLLGHSQETASNAELNIVQTAVDARMAAEGKATVTPILQADATGDMTSGGFGLYPDYMRSQATKGTYYLDADGTVHQATTGYE